MKNWMMTLAVMGSVTATMGMAVKCGQSAPTPWYQYAVQTVGPVSGTEGQSGKLLALKPGSSFYMVFGSPKNSYQITTRTLRGSVLLQDDSTDLAAALQAGKVKSMTLALPLSAVQSLEIVSNDTRTRILAKDQSEIRFDLNQESLTAGKTDHFYVLTAAGTVTVAGQIFPVTLTADATIRNGQMFVQGVQKLKMACFSRIPHFNSLVAANAGDELELHYGLLFEAN